MLNNNQKGMSTSLVVLALILAALTGCWDNLVFESADGSADTRDGTTPDTTDAMSPTDTSPDAPTDAQTDVTDAPVITDVLDGGGTDVVVPPVDVADATPSTDAPTDAQTDVTDAPVITDVLDGGGVDVVPPVDVADATPSTDAPTDAQTDVTDAPVITDVLDGGGVDVVPPVDVSCPSGLTRCGTACVNTTTDNANCGRCGGVCTVGTCGASVCRTTLTATRSQGFWAERMGRWFDVWSQTTTDLPLTSSPLVVGTFGYSGTGGGVGYNNSRLGMRFPAIPVAETRVTRAFLTLTRAGHRDDPPQYVNVVRGPCGSWTDATYERSNWGDVSFGERAAADFVPGVPQIIPATGSLRLSDSGRALLSSTGENCIGLRTRDDLVDLGTMPGFAPMLRVVAGPNTGLNIYPSPVLTIEYAP